MAGNYYRGNKKMHIHKQRSKLYKLGLFKQHNVAHLKYLQSKKNPMFDFSTDEESKDFQNDFLLSDDDQDTSMVKSLDYKHRARKASEIRSSAQKEENKKPCVPVLEVPDAVRGATNHIVETDSSQ
jgi:hypothetical protein